MQQEEVYEKRDVMPVIAATSITCGLDVHKEKIDACIRTNDGTIEGKLEEKTFSTMRGSLIELRDWILSFKCFHVLMESTGVYWMPIYFLLEEVLHMDVRLGNARNIKNTPGRPKTDKEDAKWLSRLCMLGYLLKSFIVSRPFREIREYTRYHKKLVEERARHINRIEKLLQMNGYKLSSVLSNIVGVSGRRLLTKLSEKGSVSVEDVRLAIDKRVKKTAEEIAYAINGDMKPTSRILLKAQLSKLTDCDKEISKIHELMFKLSAPYARAIEIIESIPGLSKLSALYIISEIGTDLSMFETSNHLASWAGLAPKGDVSADKIGIKRTQRANRYLKSVLVECAWATTRVKTSRLSMWFWHNKNRIGDKKAIIAVARKLLCYIYAMLRNDTLYDVSLDRAQENKNKAKKLDSARKIVDNNEKFKELKSVCDELNEKVNNSLCDVHSEKSNSETDAIHKEEDVPHLKKRGRPPKNLTAS